MSLSKATTEIHARLLSHIEQLCQADRLPGSAGYTASQDYLKAQIKELGLKPVVQRFKCQSGLDAQNIFCETPANTQKPKWLIGAHYDSLKSSGQGADDNASAVAILLELIRLLPRSEAFCFVFFDREERHHWTALEGSQRFARFYKKPLESVVIMDLVGGSLAPGFENYYFQFGDGLRDLSHPQLEISKFPRLFLEPLGRIFPRSDYHAFRKQKIPFCFLSSGTPWYYHSPHDTPDKLYFEKMLSLTETLSDIQNYKTASPRTADWTNWPRLLEKLMKIKGLENAPFFEKLREKSAPTRFELIRFYKKLLGFLKTHGAALWDQKT